MKRISLIAFVLFFSTTIHASISCSIKELALSKLPMGIAAGLECNNEQAIKDDIAAILDGAGICVDSYESEKGLGAILCRKFLPYLIDYSVDYIIPDKWDCKATNLKKTIEGFTIEYCDNL